MDNAVIFHEWDRWQDIVRTMPIIFMARPPAAGLTRMTRLKLLQNIPHHYINRGARIDLKQPGVYWMMASKLINISSSQIRKSNAKQ